MRESNNSDVSSIQNSNFSSSRKDYEDSVVIQKQVQTIKRKENDDEFSSSSINSSINSVNKSINIQEDSNNSKINNKQNPNEYDDGKIKQNKTKNKKEKKLGNKINDMMLEPDDNKSLYLRQDKEKSEQKGYTVYEISKIIENKKHILCYRR